MEAGATDRRKGIRALEEGRLDQALDHLARAVMADSRDAEAKAHLAVAYSRKGLHAQARRTIQNALELQPGSSQLRYQLGTILEREGDTEGAATAYRECLRRDPDHVESNARLELMGVSPLKPDPAAPEPEPAPQAAPVPPSPLRQPLPAEAPVRGPAGTVRCSRCLEWSKPGLSCEWCSGPLVARAPAVAPVPPPYPHPAPPPPVPGMAPGSYPAAPGFPGLYRRPHRGGAVLTLGIVGVIFVVVGFGCAPIALGGLLCSILAWVFGNTDIAEMDAGLVDEMGRGTVQAGRVLGIMGTLLSFLILLGWMMLILSITR